MVDSNLEGISLPQNLLSPSLETQSPSITLTKSVLHSLLPGDAILRLEEGKNNLGLTVSFLKKTQQKSSTQK